MNTSAEPELTAEAEEQVLQSLDLAIRDLDNGKGVPIGEVRKRISAICRAQKSRRHRRQDRILQQRAEQKRRGYP